MCLSLQFCIACRRAPNALNFIYTQGRGSRFQVQDSGVATIRFCSTFAVVQGVAERSQFLPTIDSLACVEGILHGSPKKERIAKTSKRPTCSFSTCSLIGVQVLEVYATRLLDVVSASNCSRKSLWAGPVHLRSPFFKNSEIFESRMLGICVLLLRRCAFADWGIPEQRAFSSFLELLRSGQTHDFKAACEYCMRVVEHLILHKDLVRKSWISTRQVFP